METKIAVFKGQRIRRTIHKKEWWFSVIDVIEALTGTQRPRKYWNDLKKKIEREGYDELSDFIGQLKLASSDGKYYLTDCVNPRDYWFKMKIRVKEEDGFEPSTVCRQFKLPAPDGKMRETDCANTDKEIAVNKDTQGFIENKQAAQDGGTV